MPTYNTNAIVLRYINYLEKDRIFTLFSREHGKISAIAKGVRRPGSKLSSHLDYLHLSQLQLATGKNLHIITQASILNNFSLLLKDINKLPWVYYLTEMLEKSISGQEESTKRIFDFFLKSLHYLEMAKHMDTMACSFQLQLLKILGYAPHLHACSLCDKPFQESKVKISFNSNNILCLKCSQNRDLPIFDQRTIKIAKFLTDNFVDRSLKPQIKRELYFITRGFWNNILPKNLKSWQFLKQSLTVA